MTERQSIERSANLVNAAVRSYGSQAASVGGMSRYAARTIARPEVGTSRRSRLPRSAALQRLARGAIHEHDDAEFGFDFANCEIGTGALSASNEKSLV